MTRTSHDSPVATGETAPVVASQSEVEMRYRIACADGGGREKEEAAWWDKHGSRVEADLRAAMRENRTASLSDVLARARTKSTLLPVTIRIPSEDVATARELASEKGIGYQTYIKLLLHDALVKESNRSPHRGRR